MEDLVRYEPNTGKLYSLVKRGKLHPGQELGSVTVNGYIQLAIQGKKYYAHRLAWFLMTKEWPEEVDHINRNRVDNRWENLRKATRTQNAANIKDRANSTGYRGVNYNKRDRLYYAKIKQNNKSVYLGCFKTPQEGEKAYLNAKKEKEIRTWSTSTES